MKFSTIIPFFSCITIAICYQCRWTACEGILMNGKSICDHYGYDVFTGKSRRDDCNWVTEQKFCCTKPPPVACHWSQCEGLFIDGDQICRKDNEGHFTGKRTISDCKWDSARVECCYKAPMSRGCEWVQGCFIEAYESRETRCAVEFGAEYMPTRTLHCAFSVGVTYECCPTTAEQEENLEIDEQT